MRDYMIKVRQQESLLETGSGYINERQRAKTGGYAIDHNLTFIDGRANTLLRRLSTVAMRSLRPYTKRVVLEGGEYICRPEQDVDCLYFPESTAFSELQILEDGRTIEVSLTGREGVIGLTSLFVPDRSATWVQACGPGTAIKINRTALSDEVRSVESLSSMFHRATQAYIRQMSHKVACNAHHSVLERFSTWLLLVSDRCSTHQLKLTQEQIARVLGVYRPSVTCIAQELREAGSITYVRGSIVILDREGLARHCCSCYAELASLESQDLIK